MMQPEPPDPPEEAAIPSETLYSPSTPQMATPPGLSRTEAAAPDSDPVPGPSRTQAAVPASDSVPGDVFSVQDISYAVRCRREGMNFFVRIVFEIYVFFSFILRKFEKLNV